MHSPSRRRVLAVAFVLFLAAPAWAQGRKTPDHWITTWATAVVARPQPVAPPPQAAPPAGGPAPAAPGPGRGGLGGPPLTLNNQTLRQIVHVSAGGSKVRVVLSNAFGTAPIQVGAAHVALRASEANIQPGSAKPLTVNGSESFRILAGAVAVTDTVEMTLAAGADLAIDLFFPGEVGAGASPLTIHQAANQTNYVLTTGNNNGVVAPAVASRVTSWTLLSRVEVAAPAAASTIVTFGDSITDGSRSTTDTNSRWPDVLARRLAADRKLPVRGIANEGIGGNQLLGDGAGVAALARFDRDVLLQTGATHVIVLEGINDIGLARANATPSAQDLIGAHKQMIERAHAQGLKIYGATLTPFEGASYATPEGEAKRVALNEWIRTSGMYDGVIDFDKVTRDPAAPTKFNPAFDSGDHLHPNDAGYKAMGEAVDLALFK